MNAKVCRVAFGGYYNVPMFHAYCVDVSGHCVRRDGTFHDTMYDGVRTEPLNNAKVLSSLPNSGWFETEAEAQALADKLNKPAKPKRARKAKPKRVYYKVVCQEWDYINQAYRLRSVASALPRELQLTYKVGEVTVPKLEGSRLFVFGDLKSAQRFVHNKIDSHPARIYTCEVTNPHRAKILGQPSNALEFWREYLKMRRKRKAAKKNQKLLYVLKAKVYDSTYTVDSVKLLAEANKGTWWDCR